MSKKKKKNTGLLILWIVSGIVVFFGFWFLMILAFIYNLVNIGFGMMLSVFAIPLGIMAGGRLANPKKKRRKRRKNK